MAKESATSTIGPKGLFSENDENIRKLLEEKQKVYLEWQNDRASTSKRD